MTADNASEIRAFHVAELDKLEARLFRRVRISKYMPIVFIVCLTLAIAELNDAYHFSGKALFGLFMGATAVVALVGEGRMYLEQDLLVLHAALRHLYRDRGGV